MIKASRGGSFQQSLPPRLLQLISLWVCRTGLGRSDCHKTYRGGTSMEIWNSVVTVFSQTLEPSKLFLFACFGKRKR